MPDACCWMHSAVTPLSALCASLRCDARLGLGSLHLLPERRGPAGSEDLGAGDPAGPAPRAGPWLRRRGRRSVRQLFWYVRQKWCSGKMAIGGGLWVLSVHLTDAFPVCSAGAAETFRGIGMASLVILLIFSFIQCLTRDTEGRGGSNPCKYSKKQDDRCAD